MADVDPIVPADYGDLAELLACFPGLASRRAPTEWQRRFLHWWDTNPFMCRDDERGWILRSDGQIVGVLGVVRTPFQLAGSETRAANATTWYVLPDFRAHSLALLSKLLALASDSVIFDTTPTESVVQLLEQMHFRHFPRRRQRARVTLYLQHPARVFARRFRDHPALRFVARYSAPVVIALQHVRRWRAKADHRLVTRVIARADDGFDTLWQRTRHLYAHTNIRTSRFINWYCSDAALQPKQLLGCFRNGDPVGFAILHVETAGGTTLGPQVKCVDIWHDPSVPHVVDTLAEYMIRCARELNADTVILPHFTSTLASVFGRTALIGTTLDRAELYRSSTKLSDRDAYLTDAQGDYLL